MDGSHKGSLKALLVGAIWLCLSTALSAVEAKDMSLRRGAHNLIAQHIASAKGAIGNEKPPASKQAKANSDDVGASLNGRFEDIDRMDAKSFTWMPDGARHGAFAVIFGLAGLIAGWMVLQLLHMQGFKFDGPAVPIGGMILFVAMAPFTNYFDDIAARLPVLQQMVPYTDLSHESQKEFLPIRSGAFGLTAELPQPYRLTRTLVDKVWITSLLYSRREGSYSLSYHRVPEEKLQQRDASHDEDVVVIWDTGRSLDLPEPTRFDRGPYDGESWLNRLAQIKTKRLNITNVKVTPVALYNRYPGRLIEGNLPDGSNIELRVYTANGNLYTLIVSGTPQWMESSDAALFLDSFNID